MNTFVSRVFRQTLNIDYRYDIHGNVKSLLHDNPVLAAKSSSLADQRYKRLDYTYDLM